MNWLNQISSECRDCSTEIIGRSFEGRKLKLIKVNSFGLLLNRNLKNYLIFHNYILLS